VLFGLDGSAEAWNHRRDWAVLRPRAAMIGHDTDETLHAASVSAHDSQAESTL
jgi:hypothetical protein